MAQTYTQEEAAARLGISTEEFKRKLKTEWTKVVPMRDGPTLRFRTVVIDELARTLGAASDPGLQLGKPGSKPEPGSDDFLLADDSPSDDIPLSLSLDEPTKKKSGSDSDVRLDPAGKRPKKKDGSGEEASITEEISLDIGGPGSAVIKSGGSGKLIAPNAGHAGPKSAKIPGPGPNADMGGDSSSEFELSLDSESDSFELQLNSDSSEEIDLGGSPTTGTPRGAKSGLNLSKPKDSGISLENGDADEDSLEFDLAIDPPSKAGNMKKPAAKMNADSDSEFELSLDDNSGVTDSLAESIQEDENKGDIFETDFEMPRMDDSDSVEITADEESGSEVVAIDGADTDVENSDFDLALDESDMVVEEDDDSASQVVLVDEDAPVKKGGKGKLAAGALAAGALGAGALAARKRKTADDDDDDGSVGSALRGSVEEDEDGEPIRTVAGTPAKWGALPVIALALSFLFVFIGSLMGFEVVRSMWGYHQPTKVSAPLVDGLAGAFGMAPKVGK